MGTGCKQLNIPEVDNTELECEEFISSLCVKFAKANPYLGLPKDSNLEEYINKLITIIQNSQRLIKQQRIEIDQLRVDVDSLLP